MGYEVHITYEGRTRRIGRVEHDTLYCSRTVKEHLFRYGRDTVATARKQQVSAWGLDCKVCDGLLEKGVKWLRINAGAHSYQVELEKLRTEGEVLHMKPHRAQYFLNELKFKKERIG